MCVRDVLNNILEVQSRHLESALITTKAWLDIERFREKWLDMERLRGKYQKNMIMG